MLLARSMLAGSKRRGGPLARDRRWGCLADRQQPMESHNGGIAARDPMIESQSILESLAAKKSPLAIWLSTDHQFRDT